MKKQTKKPNTSFKGKKNIFHSFPSPFCENLLYIGTENIYSSILVLKQNETGIAFTLHTKV